MTYKLPIKQLEFQIGDLVEYRGFEQDKRLRGYGIITGLVKDRYPQDSDPYDQECYIIFWQNLMQEYKIHYSSIVKV